MSFGMDLVAFFCSPVYFLMRKRWGAFLLHCVLYVTALVTLMVFGLGIVFWFIGVAHAMWDLRSNLMESAMQRQAELIAQKMVKEQKPS